MAAPRGLSCAPTVSRVLVACAAIALLAPSAPAQDSGGDAGGSVFAPFVSRVRIAIRDPEVRLTWRDSADVDGNYLIYRHSSEITADTFLDADLVAEVEPGVQSFIDAPAEPGSYYYGVLATSAAGEAYEIFIPYRNTTAAAVTIANVATLQERSARVQDIQAVADRGTILVQYRSSQVGRELIVYRSTRPFTSAEDLVSAGVVSTVMSTVETVTDYPVPGVPYYYAVADSALIADGSVTFVAGQNATPEPVEVPLESYASAIESEPEPADQPAAEAEPEETRPVEVAAAGTQATETVTTTQPGAAPAAEPSTATTDMFSPAVTRRRPLPLPFLQLSTDLRTGGQLDDAAIVVPARQPIADETRTAVEAMTLALAPGTHARPSPQILEDDTLPSPRGAEFTLRTILDGPFANLAWEDALLQLNNFLSLPLAGDIRARAVFYRAQCYYFTGESRRAFMEFLLARDAHFSEVEKWLDVILSDTAGA